MMQIANYDYPLFDWVWTGYKRNNQMWSFFRVTRPILVTSIDVHWGGYGGATKGRHFICHYTSGKGEKLGGLVVRSGVIDVPMGRKWRRAEVPMTYLEPGTYSVGIHGHYWGRRQVSQYADGEGLLTYTHTDSRLDPDVDGTRWRARGVIPSRLNYIEAGRTHVKVHDSWRMGQAHVKVHDNWVKSNGVWVKVHDNWRRS